MLEGNNILKQDRGFNAQFVQTGQRPQNFIKNVNPSQRYHKYPKSQQLMQQKKIWLQQRNHPAVYIKQNLKEFDLASLGKFDLIYCDPPWKQYEKRAKNLNLYDRNQDHYKAWTLQQLLSLNVQNLADSPCFIFLWVGSEHLDDGRELFKKWGFKRCEDIVWIKTNTIKKKVPPQSDEGILVRVKEHCLVGYKGQAKKASDHNFIHPNIDIDVVVTEQPQLGSLQKPTQFYEIIERFCLGRKKIQIFGNDLNIRNGWLTIGNQLTETKFIRSEYDSWFDETITQPKGYRGWRRMGTTPVIQSLRPREDQKNEDEGKRSINSK